MELILDLVVPHQPLQRLERLSRTVAVGRRLPRALVHEDRPARDGLGAYLRLRQRVVVEALAEGVGFGGDEGREVQVEVFAGCVGVFGG